MIILAHSQTVADQDEKKDRHCEFHSSRGTSSTASRRGPIEDSRSGPLQPRPEPGGMLEPGGAGPGPEGAIIPSSSEPRWVTRNHRRRTPPCPCGVRGRNLAVSPCASFGVALPERIPRALPRAVSAPLETISSIPHDRPIRHARKRGQTWMASAGSGGAVSPFSSLQASQAAIVSGGRTVSTARG